MSDAAAPHNSKGLTGPKGLKGLDPLTRQALATTAGVVAAVLVALFAGFANPYWAALSAIVIANSDPDELFTKGLLRIGATIAGVVLGYHAALLLEGHAVAEILAIMLGATLGVYGRQRSAYGYAWFYAGLTFLLIIAASMTDPGGLRGFAYNRCFEIVTGVGAATLARWALGGDEARPRRLRAHPPTVPSGDALRVALAAAAGTLAILVAWRLFALPSVPQVIISSLIVVDAKAGQTRLRGGQRIIGCLIGGLAGLAVIAIDAGSFAWWLGAIAVGTYLTSRVHLGTSPNAYIGTQSAVAFLYTLVDSGPPASILPPVERLVGVTLGVAVMTVITYAITHRADPAAAPR